MHRHPWTGLVVVVCLGVVAISGVLGMITLAALGQTPPHDLGLVSAAAVGALGALLARVSAEPTHHYEESNGGR